VNPLPLTTFWFVVLVSVPGMLYGLLLLALLLLQIAGVSVSQLNDALTRIGLQSLFATTYMSTVFWAWFGPVFVLAGGVATGVASRNGRPLTRRLRWMWGMTAVSLGSWLCSVLFWSE
jgi:hypothetical protein